MKTQYKKGQRVKVNVGCWLRANVVEVTLVRRTNAGYWTVKDDAGQYYRKHEDLFF